MKVALAFALLIVAAPFMRADDKQPLHLTGNPRADFFSNPPGLVFDRGQNADSVSPTVIEMPEHNRKSPWIAGALSLAVPGAGEVYTGSYLKGAVFFTVEAVSWITRYTYTKKGDDQTAIFQAYANAHWSATRYALWMKNHLDQIAQNNNKQTPSWDSYQVFRNPADTVCSPPFSCLNWRELNKLEQDGLGFGHGLPYWGDQQYYELIGKYDQFSKGWDSQIGDETDYRLGNKQFDMYRAMFNQADKYYDVASSWLSVIIANHILSAVDAVWSATRHNSSLHAEVRMRMVPTRSGFAPMTEANIHFSF